MLKDTVSVAPTPAPVAYSLAAELAAHANGTANGAMSDRLQHILAITLSEQPGYTFEALAAVLAPASARQREADLAAIRSSNVASYRAQQQRRRDIRAEWQELDGQPCDWRR